MCLFGGIAAASVLVPRPMRRFAPLSLALLLGTSALPACGGRQQGEVPTYTEAAAIAYADAERAFERRDYELARLRFTEVYNNFPYSQYAAMAEFRIGDAYLRERSYARSIEAFRRFVRIHPTHQLVPEAQYKIALSYVQQMPRDFFLRPPSFERDLSDTENAHRALQLFLSAYSETEFADDARVHLAVTTGRLAAYELYVAEFYTRRDNPRAAALRCETLLHEFPDAEQVPNALFLHARSLIELGDVEQAVVSLRRLVDEFPNHALVPQARTWLGRHAG